MNLSAFLEQFEQFSPAICYSFENQWNLYKNDLGTKGLTYIIRFEGQEYRDANVSLTFVEDELVEGDIGFRDCKVTYIRNDYYTGYQEECHARNINMGGTRHVWDFDDFIPNRYVILTEFIEAMGKYASLCSLTAHPYYEDPEPEPKDEVCPNMRLDSLENEQGKQYRVFFNVRLDYTVDSAKNMDDALAQASEALYNDFDFMFDDDAIVVHERAVFETVNGDNNV